jgi:hypothetical protein
MAEWEQEGVTERLVEYPPHCHFVHHKSHKTRFEIDPLPPQRKLATNLQSYGTILSSSFRLIVGWSLHEWVRQMELSRTHSSTIDGIRINGKMFGRRHNNI